MNKDEVKKSFVRFNEKGEPVLKLEPATPEVIKRHAEILKLHKEGKLKALLK